MATGRPILGDKVIGGPLRAVLISLEDGKNELQRRITASMKYHHIEPEEIIDESGVSRLMILTAEKKTSIKIATQSKGETKIVKSVVESIKKQIKKRRIDVVIIDPFVSCHAVNENDNSAIDRVTKTLASIASECKCAIGLVHHTRKTGANGDSGADDSRGAKAFTDACRIVRKTAPMTKDEATELGCEDKHWNYFRVTDEKHNQAPARDATWRHLESVSLGNSDGVNGQDWVGVVEEWKPRGVLERHPEWAQVVLKVLADGKHRLSPQSKYYAGKAIAEALGLDFDDKGVKVQMKALIAKLLGQGRIESVDGKDEHRNNTTFLKVTDPDKRGRTPI